MISSSCDNLLYIFCKILSATCREYHSCGGKVSSYRHSVTYANCKSMTAEKEWKRPKTLKFEDMQRNMSVKGWKIGSVKVYTIFSLLVSLNWQMGDIYFGMGKDSRFTFLQQSYQKMWLLKFIHFNWKIILLLLIWTKPLSFFHWNKNDYFTIFITTNCRMTESCWKTIWLSQLLS